MNRRDILEIDRSAILDLQHYVVEISDVLDVAAPPHEELSSRNLESFPTDILVALFNRIDDVIDRDIVSDQFVWIDFDLVLLDEAPNRGDFGHTLNGFQRITKVPVLERAKLCQVVFTAVVDKGILEYPSNSSRIGTDNRIYVLR